MYLLDANAWIAIFRQKSDALLNELKRRSPAEILLCSVVLSELWYGVCRSPSEHRAKNQHLVEDVQARYVSVPLDDAAVPVGGYRNADLYQHDGFLRRRLVLS